MYTPKDIAEAIAKMIRTGDMDASTNAMCDLADRVASENGLSEEWWRAIKRGETPLITIYERPVDFPDEYVARLWLIRRGTEAPVMTAIVLRAASLDELRAMLPPGLRRLPREPDDEVQIVETWI
jgi:hypothetical protein